MTSSSRGTSTGDVVVTGIRDKLAHVDCDITQRRDQMIAAGITEDEADELDTIRVQALAEEGSLRRLHKWKVLAERPYVTWRREEVRAGAEERYGVWWRIWAKFEEGEGEAQEAEDKRRMDKAALRDQFGHNQCLFCWK